MRIHPSLTKETQSKFDDASVEWRQYCLDEKYTNLNKIKSKMFHASSIIQIQQRPSPQTQITSTAVQPFLLPSSQPSIYSSNASIVTPLSPSYQAASLLTPSIHTKSIQEPLSSSDLAKFRIASSTSSSKSAFNTNNPASVPSTPTADATCMSVTSATAKVHQIFQFPSIESLDKIKGIDEQQQQPSSTNDQPVNSYQSLTSEASQNFSDMSTSTGTVASSGYYGYLKFPHENNINGTNKKPIQNLTTRFMQTTTDEQQPDDSKKSTKTQLEKHLLAFRNLNQLTTANARLSFIQIDNSSSSLDKKDRFLLRQKSLSETNLTTLMDHHNDGNDDFFGRRPKAHTFLTNTQQQQRNGCYNSQRVTSAKSEMRDTNIISGGDDGRLQPQQPPLSFNSIDSNMCNRIGGQCNDQQTSNTNDNCDIDYSYPPTCINSSKKGGTSNDPNDVLSTYLANGDSSELYYELLYERSLREKYEEMANKFYYLKIERDQFLNEKLCLEKTLKDTVEKHRREIEDYLISPTRIELSDCHKKIEEKEKEIK